MAGTRTGATTPDGVADRVDEVAQRGWDGLQPLLDQRIIDISGLTLTVGGLAAATIAILLALGISILVRRGLDRYGRRENVNRPALYTVSRLVHYTLLALGVMFALELAGVPISRFAVFAGAIGLGLGFGLQAIFSNFISGLILLFDKSLKVGDFIELEDDVRGTVRDINIRATRITTNDNIDILVPNSEFVTGRVVNWTHRDVRRRLRVPFGVAYGVDKELVKKAALEAARNVPFTLANDGPYRPQVWLVGFGDSAVEYILAVWLTEDATRRNAAIKAAYLWELDTQLKAHCIEIPFPQRDLHLRSVFGMSGSDALELLRGGRGATGDTRPGARPDLGDAPRPPELSAAEKLELSDNDASRETSEPPVGQDPSGGPDDPAAPETDDPPAAR